MTLGGEMNIELTAPTRGSLHEHIFTPPALPICFDSSSVVSIYPSESGLDFVVGINAIAWGQCDEIYPYPHREEMLAEWTNVEHNIPAILSKWRNYGLFGTNIEGWFTLDTRNMDGILRAIALFGSVLWVDRADHPDEGESRVLCGFHSKLGVNSLDVNPGTDFEHLIALGSEAYVVVPTIMAEIDHHSMQYLKYETLETE
jgi:hypothetical protein